ncbi:hypothetical protein PMZ80_001420 [Knufia obscura]|uniref:Uncharacterized protein n=1 Tax=Knufia obscura TaxID=1635080 RepID=A0ABR0S355_9EURO|nr:hypothetical protein PMZ80_001420 [Knufia obscura]
MPIPLLPPKYHEDIDLRTQYTLDRLREFINQHTSDSARRAGLHDLLVRHADTKTTPRPLHGTITAGFPVAPNQLRAVLDYIELVSEGLPGAEAMVLGGDGSAGQAEREGEQKHEGEQGGVCEW